jgi:F-type H+-transporting ATPase subunit epsilon
VTVLATEATPVAELSKAAGQERLSAAEADYAKADKMDVSALDAAMDRMQSARAMIEAAQAA